MAAWLIERGRERINEVAVLVAGHFEQAGDSANAAEWFGRAGQQARAGFAPASAIDYFHKALRCCPRPGTAKFKPNTWNGSAAWARY